MHAIGTSLLCQRGLNRDEAWSLMYSGTGSGNFGAVVDELSERLNVGLVVSISGHKLDRWIERCGACYWRDPDTAELQQMQPFPSISLRELSAGTGFGLSM